VPGLAFTQVILPGVRAFFRYVPALHNGKIQLPVVSPANQRRDSGQKAEIAGRVVI